MIYTGDAVTSTKITGINDLYWYLYRTDIMYNTNKDYLDVYFWTYL